MDPVTNKTVWQSDTFSYLFENRIYLRNLEHDSKHIYVYGFKAVGEKPGRRDGRDVGNLHAIDIETGKTDKTHNLFPKEGLKFSDESSMFLDFVSDESLFYPLLNTFEKGPSHEPNPLYAIDKKEGNFAWQYIKPGKLVQIHRFANPAIKNGNMYFSSMRVTDYRAQKGSGYIHALPMDLKEADTNYKKTNCQATPVLEAEGRGYQAQKTKRRFQKYFQRCNPVKLKIEQSQLGVKVSYEILGETDDGDCRVEFKFLEKPGKAAYELDGKAVQFTLDPDQSFLEQVKQAVPKCLDGDGEGNYDCQTVEDGR